MFVDVLLAGDYGNFVAVVEKVFLKELSGGLNQIALIWCNEGWPTNSLRYFAISDFKFQISKEVGKRLRRSQISDLKISVLQSGVKQTCVKQTMGGEAEDDEGEAENYACDAETTRVSRGRRG